MGIKEINESNHRLDPNDFSFGVSYAYAIDTQSPVPLAVSHVNEAISSLSLSLPSARAHIVQCTPSEGQGASDGRISSEQSSQICMEEVR